MGKEKMAVIEEIVKTIIDAADIDIQLYMVKVLTRLKETDHGSEFVSWAEDNPGSFEALIRVISVIVQRFPNNGNIVMNAVYDHLRRMPFEIRRSTFSDEFSTESDIDVDKNDDFFERYSMAVNNLNDDELLIVASLSKSKLREWVDAPEEIKPVLLRKFRLKQEFPKSFFDKTSLTLGDISGKLGKATENFADSLIEEVHDPGMIKGIFMPEIRFFKKIWLFFMNKKEEKKT